MNFRGRKRRGIVLIIALVTMVLITMIVAAVATAMPVQLFASAHGKDTQSAISAAKAGLDYAYCRLQENRLWQGDGDTGAAGPHLIVNTPELQVVEDEGNVIGVLSDPDGQKTAFRFRFNFQDGNSNNPADGVDNLPASSHLIYNRYLSSNNIFQSIMVKTYDGDPSNGVVINTQTGTLSPFTAEIKVEGLAGPGLAGATVDNIQNLLNSSAARQIYAQHAAGRFSVAGSGQVDSVVAAANSLYGKATDVTGPAGQGKFSVTEAPNVTAPKARARTTAKVDGTYSTTGEIRVDDKINSSITGTVPIQEDANLQDPHFLRIKSTQVTKATAANTNLRAGTYVWRTNPAGGYKLDYYAQNFTSGVPVGTPDDTLASTADYSRFISNGSALNFDFTNMNASLTDKVFVSPQPTASDLAIVIDPTLQASSPIRPTATFVDTGTSSSVLSGAGNISIQGSIDGYGGITSDHDINFQGASAFETDPMNSICVYAKGDINISAIPDSVVAAINTATGVGMGMGQKVGWQGMGGMAMGMQAPTTTTAFPAGPGDVTLTGIIYALGNFNLNLTSSTDPSKHGTFFMEGLLTAYGGNPDDGDTPGHSGKGQVNILAKNAELYYDPSYLQQLQGVGGLNGITLQQVSWNLIP
ncbi:MAG: hypothetical protein U0931_14515 [Vulcanimicrobiota bacterium]